MPEDRNIGVVLTFAIFASFVCQSQILILICLANLSTFYSTFCVLHSSSRVSRTPSSRLHRQHLMM